MTAPEKGILLQPLCRAKFREASASNRSLL
jgi:hypothetical protein